MLSNSRRSICLQGLLVGLLCLTGPALADEAPAPAAAGGGSQGTTFDTPTPRTVSPAQTAEFRAFLAPRLDWSDVGLVEVVDPDGGYSMDPQGRFQSVTLARIDDEGRLEVRFFTGLEGAMSFLTFQDVVAPAAPGHELATE